VTARHADIVALMIADWSFTDGYTVFNNPPTPYNSSVSIRTDSEGNIEEWAIGFSQSMSSLNPAGMNWMFSHWGYSNGLTGDIVYYCNNIGRITGSDSLRS
jgi:hypothetical protein